MDTEHSFGVEHFTFAVRCLKEENKKLKQEYDELKKESKNAYWLRDCEQKRNLKLEKTLKKEILKQYQYRKAIENIEKIIKEYDCVNCSEQHCEDCNKGEIFYIINKAKEEE